MEDAQDKIIKIDIPKGEYINNRFDAFEANWLKYISKQGANGESSNWEPLKYFK